jgi:CHAT domain-containing protein
MPVANHRPHHRNAARRLLAAAVVAWAVAAAAGPAAPERYTTLNREALARYEAGNFDAAAHLLREALADAHRALGEDHEDSLALENNLAAMLQAEGRYREAEPHFAHVLAVRSRTLAADDPRTLGARNNLAEALQGEGRYRRAEALLRTNHAAWVRQRGEGDPESLRALNNLAAVLALRGQLEEAERLHRRALAAQRAALSAADPAVLASVENLATVLDAQGQHAEAEALHRQVVDARTRTEGAAHPGTLAARGNLAASLHAQSRFGDAEAELRSALEAARAGLGKHHPLTLAMLDTLALTLGRQDRFTEAEQLHREVLAARTHALGSTHPDTLAAMANLAASLRGPGAASEAAALYAAAADGSDAALGPLHPTSLQVRTRQAHFLLAAARHADALAALQALEPRLRGREEYEAARARDSERLRRLERSDAGFVDLVLTLAMRAPALAGRYAADVVVRTKYVGAETDAIVEHAARSERDPAVLAIIQRVRKARAFVARAAHRVGSGDADGLHRALAQLEADEATLARHSGAFATAREHAATADASRIAAALPPGALLLDLRRYHDALQPDLAAADRYAVVLIAADGGVELHDLGPVAATLDAVRDASDLGRIIEDDDGARARELHAALFGPLDARLATASRVYLAPDGPLHAVPFHALVLADGRYWTQRHAVHVLGSARDLLHPERVHSGDRLLAIGGVDYGDGRTSGGAAPAFVPLPGSRREAEALHARWRERGLPARVLSDAGASEAALKALTLAPDYLHLATHGFFEDGPESAHLPLAASGIALAGANLAHPGDDAADDGILYAEEALDLDLEGTELVVLSACETARGVDANWEGSLGLVRALRTAGARNVVSSLWQISDDYAVPFMQEFYDRLLQDPARDAAAALRATQLAWIGAEDPARRFPENWAAFVLVQRR